MQASIPEAAPQTYLTTAELSALIKYDSRTIRDRLKDSVLIEGRHYIRPFGGRKTLYMWEHIQEDMARPVTPVRGIVVQLPEERPAIAAKGRGEPTEGASSTGTVDLANASDAGNGEGIRALDELGPDDEAITRSSAADLRRRRAPDDSTSLMSLIKRPELPAFLKQD